MENAEGRLSEAEIAELESLNADPSAIAEFWIEKGEYALAGFALQQIKQPTVENRMEIAKAFQTATHLEPDSSNKKEYYAYSAQKHLEIALAAEPENLAIKKELAMIKIEGFGFPMAGVPLLLEVVAEDSTDMDAQFTLGRLAIMSRQYENAIKRLDMVLTDQPGRLDATYLLSDAYAGMGELGMARAALEGLLEKDRQNLDVYYKLAELCTSFQEFDLAIEYLEQIKEYYPDNEKIRTEADTQIKEILDLINQNE